MNSKMNSKMSSKMNSNDFSNDLWNISIKIKDIKIKINSSVFFFLVVPLIYYSNYNLSYNLSKESNGELFNFIKSYAAVFIFYTIYKVILSLLKKKNSVIYPFGIFQNNTQSVSLNTFKLKKSFLTNLIILICDVIFCVILCLYLYSNNLEFRTFSYPIFLLLVNIFSNQIYYNKNLNFKKKTIIIFLTFTYFATVASLDLFFTSKQTLSFPNILSYLFKNIEDAFLFLSFTHFVINKENLKELESIGKDFSVKKIMTPENCLKTLSPTDTVDGIIDDIIKLPQKVFPVLVNDKIIGIVRKDEILIHFKLEVMNDYPLIEEIMTKITAQVSPNSNILTVKKVFDKSSLSSSFSSLCVPVVKDGIFMGLLFYEIFLEFISIRKHLDKLKINENT